MGIYKEWANMGKPNNTIEHKLKKNESWTANFRILVAEEQK